MGWKAELRAMEAAQRRQERDAKKRQRELERLAKGMAQLSAQEQARLEVETYENALDVLLSIHKEQATTVDWMSIATSLPPVPPCRHSHNELKARQHLAALPQPNDDTILAQARQKDEREFQDAIQIHAAEHAEWQKMSHLARQMLQGDSGAYIEAIEEVNPFAELSGIGTSLHFTVHTARLVEVVLTTSGRRAIPTEVKSLTASGKVSIKNMPKARFVGVYQDYVSGCVLRVARELFALLPIQTLLITASAETIDPSTGQTIERPFLSVAIARSDIQRLNFGLLDPSDTILALSHRGDLIASRKTGDFDFIEPLTVADVSTGDAPAISDFGGVVVAMKRLRSDIAARCNALNPSRDQSLLTNGEEAP